MIIPRFGPMRSFNALVASWLIIFRDFAFRSLVPSPQRLMSEDYNFPSFRANTFFLLRLPLAAKPLLAEDFTSS